MKSAAESAADIVFVVHAGAGSDVKREFHSAEREDACRSGLETALRAGYTILQSHGTALDAIEAAVRTFEDNPYFNAGRGASFGFDGTITHDASIMDGKEGNAGAIAGVSIVKNPITLARCVMEHSPYVMLMGAGAEAFASENGLELVDNAYFETPERRAQYEKLMAQGGYPTNTAALPAEGKHGTVGAVARDSGGNLAAATSTGGMAMKRYGRIGDSPIIGAGTWAENAACAISATGHGEYFIRRAVAHDIAARIKYAAQSLEQAAQAVILRELAAMGGDGGVIGLDTKGNSVAAFNTSGMYRGWITANGEVTVRIFADEG